MRLRYAAATAAAWARLHPLLRCGALRERFSGGAMSILGQVKHTLAVSSLDATARAVLRDKLTYLAPEKLRRMRRAIDDTRPISGDIAEFGIALGGSGIMLALSAAAPKRFFGFDVFGMIPPPTSDKDDEKSRGRYDIIKSGRSTGLDGDEYYGYKKDLYSEVAASFEKYGVPADNQKVFLVKGLFEETWPGMPIGSLSLVHIDCDWYDPVRYCLNSVADKMSKDAIIVIDDYHDYGGCRAAVDEFLGDRTDFRLEPGLNPFLRRV